MFETEKPGLRSILPGIYLGARYYAAFELLSYGFAKVMGAQFTVLDSQLAKPLGDVSGFWLTWYYFGYSPIYSNVIAFAQIAGAILLCFRRTALPGVLLLLPVMANIVCIDIWVIQFPSDSGALRNAVYVLTALAVVLAFHARSLWLFLLARGRAFALLPRTRPWLLAIQIAVVAGLVGYTAHDGYWLANVNNRAPTPIDGTWHVVQAEPVTANTPDWIYFEYNRAFMTVFHYQDGHTETHDFRADPVTHALTISQDWLTPGSEIFNGKWERVGDTLTLSGAWQKGPMLSIHLSRKPMKIKDHE